MKPKLILCLALVLSGGLFGCSTARPAKILTDSSSHGSTNGFGGYYTDGHAWGIEGKVMRIQKTATVLKSITIKLIKPLPTALGYVPYETPGEVIVVHFDESLSKLGTLQIEPGSIIRVLVFPAEFGGPNPASNFSTLTVRKDGAFYDTEGNKVEYLDLRADDLPLSILSLLGIEFWKMDLQSDPDETVSVSLMVKDSDGSIEWLEKDSSVPWAGRCPVVVVSRPDETTKGNRLISLLVGGNGGALNAHFPDWGHSTEMQPRKLGNGEYLLEEAYSPIGGNNRYTKKLILVIKRSRNGKSES